MASKAEMIKDIEELDEVEELEPVEKIELPAGGIAEFIPDDEDDDEDDADFEAGEAVGIAQFPELAKKMAAYGRNEDKFLAHVAAGELVIPYQYLEDDVIRQRIYDILTEAGVDDPEAYVVGSDANDLNPTTGLPEFFFKKAFKKIGKLFKKALPILLTVGLTAMGVPPIYATGLSSGIGALANGGDLGDALKAGVTGAATAGIMAGATGAVTGKGFSAGIKQGLSDQSVPLRGSLGFDDPSTSVDKSKIINNPSINEMAGVNTKDVVLSDLSPNPDYVHEIKGGDFNMGDTWTKTKNFLTQGNLTDAQMVERQVTAGQTAYDAAIKANQGVALAQKASATAYANAGASALETYGPSAALAGGAMYLGGGFETPEQEKPEDLPTGSDLIASDPGKYLLHNIGNRQLDPETGEYVTADPLPPTYTAGPVPVQQPTPNSGYVPQYDANGELIPVTDPRYDPFTNPVQTAAAGGPVFPRRNGGIAPEEGVQGEDSVRAMLMPGEFVMTTDAVRGLGEGNLNNGIKNMYAVMRDLESRGRGTA